MIIHSWHSKIIKFTLVDLLEIFQHKAMNKKTKKPNLELKFFSTIPVYINIFFKIIHEKLLESRLSFLVLGTTGN